MDPDDDILHRVHSLSDLELAVLLSLASREHCVIGTPRAGVDDLAGELYLIATKIFGLPCAVVDCHRDTTLDDFSAAVLLPPAAPGPARHDRSSARPPSARSPPSYLLMTPASVASASTSPTVSPYPLVANVVLAKNLNRAPEAVQIQALELLRAKGALPRTTGQAAPQPFLFVAVVAAERGFRWDGPDKGETEADADTDANHPPHMTAHLNDVFAMGHWHDTEDGYPNVDDREEELRQQHEEEKLSPIGRAETAPVVRRRWQHDSENETDADSVIKHPEPDAHRRSTSLASLGRSARRASRVDSASISISTSSMHAAPPAAAEPFVSTADVDHLAALSSAVRMDMDVLRYQMNVVAFLRMHRAVAVISRACSGTSSVSPAATKHFEKLARCLAPLHRLDYVTPALVALAARKTYLHRIRTIATAEAQHERSMQWGSTQAAVEAVLEGVSPEDVIEDVLGVVMPPV